MTEHTEVKKNGWNEWSKLILFQITSLDADVKELKELRHSDRAFLIKSIEEVKATMVKGQSSLESTINLMQQGIEQRAAIKSTQTINKASARSAWISLATSLIVVVAGALITYLLT